MGYKGRTIRKIIREGGGGGGAGEVQKKYSRKAKFMKWKKKNHARQLTLKKIHANA